MGALFRTTLYIFVKSHNDICKICFMLFLKKATVLEPSKAFS